MWRRSSDEYDYIVKIVVIGDSYVGKSSILLRYCDEDFSPTFITTIGIDFKVRTVNIEGKVVKLQIWDTAGQERFKTITNSYYRGAKAIMLVYDITSIDSFEHVHVWMDNMYQHCDDSSPPMKMLIGNKKDLEKDRKVKEIDGEKLAKEFGFSFFEVSAKDGTNINKSFEKLAKDTIDIMIKKNLEIFEKNNVQLYGSSVFDVEETNKKCCYY